MQLKLKELLAFRSEADLVSAHRDWIEEALIKKVSLRRDGKWTESIAGGEAYVVATLATLGVKGQGRELIVTCIEACPICA
jgi:hypothetical protein